MTGKPCIYTYNGKEYSEKEFKAILLDGEYDRIKETLNQSNSGSGNIPPNETPSATEGSAEESGFTSVRKEKLEEIKDAKKIFEQRYKKTWSNTYESALKNVQDEYPQYSLYDAMRAKVGEFMEKLNNKKLFNPTSEDIAVFNVLRNETERRINNIEGMDSDNLIKRQAALAEFDPLHQDLLNIAKVTNPEGEAGRAFNMLQSEVKNDPEYGLKIRRMQLLKAKHGEKLTPEEEKFAKDHWEKERELYKKEEQLRTESMRQGFQDQMDELTRQYEKKIADLSKESSKNKTTTQKTLSQKGKDIADQIRKLKKPKGSTNIDFTLGTWDLAVEGIAKLVEAGSTVAEAIDNMVKEGKIAFKKSSDKENFEGLLA